MAQPLNLRTTIVKYRDSLEAFGIVHAVREQYTMGTGGQRTTTAYYLNEEQALYICTLSKTDAGHRVRTMLIKTFSAFRRGELVPAKPALPDFTNPVAAARAWADQYEQRLVLEKKPLR